MNLFLLDTDCILDLHSLGYWEKIIETVSAIYISETVCREAEYYYNSNGIRVSLDLRQLPKVRVLNGQLENLLKIMKISPNIDAGEAESLSILLVSDEYVFCSCDELAIRTAVFIRKNEQIISMERLVRRCGLTPRNLEKPTAREEVFRRITDQANQEWIMNFERFDAILN